jgi:hypothetical protein
MAAGSQRHRLLLYTRLFGMMRVPTFLITVLSGVLWWYASEVPWLANDLSQWGLLGVIIVCGVLCLYALVGPWLSYVRCFPKYLLVNTPLYRLVISYSRIRTVRPVKFAPEKRTWSQEQFLEPFLGRTVVMVDLNGYPVSEKWLRIWLNKFMFTPEATGLLFITQDWMALSRDIETHRSEWKTRRIQRAPSPSINPFARR